MRWRIGSLRIERGLGLGLGGLVVALLVPLAFSGPNLNFLTQGFIYALIALTLVVLTGWAGQISLAQFSFVGVGAFTAGHLSGAHGQHFLFAVLMGMLFAAPLGIIVGLVSLRLSGLYLALATLAFALVMDNVVFNRNDVTGGLTGITVPRPHFLGLSFTGRTSMYELAVVVFGLLAIVAYALRQGPIGRRLHIVRDSPLAASTLGVNLTVTKVVVFVVGAMVAALAGSLYGAEVQAITPQDFMWSASLELLLLVVFGGRCPDLRRGDRRCRRRPTFAPPDPDQDRRAHPVAGGDRRDRVGPRARGHRGAGAPPDPPRARGAPPLAAPACAAGARRRAGGRAQGGDQPCPMTPPRSRR